jgi:hypothetical protein
MRRVRLRGRENLRERYLIHVAGHDLGLVMRLLVGVGTPREFLARASGLPPVLTIAGGVASVVMIAVAKTEADMRVVTSEPDPHDRDRAWSTRCHAIEAGITPSDRVGEPAGRQDRRQDLEVLLARLAGFQAV